VPTWVEISKILQAPFQKAHFWPLQLHTCPISPTEWCLQPLQFVRRVAMSPNTLLALTQTAVSRANMDSYGVLRYESHGMGTNQLKLSSFVFNLIQVMELVSSWGPLIYMGGFAASLSSAIASLVGAPRVLQVIIPSSRCLAGLPGVFNGCHVKHPGFN